MGIENNEVHKTESIKMNFVMNSILTMSSYLFQFITFAYVTRVLKPAALGKVAFALSFVTYFSMFAQLGIPTYGIRACAKVRDHKSELEKTVKEIFTINYLTMAAAYIVYGLVVLLIPRFHEDKWLYLIISIIIFFNTAGAEWLFKGLEQYRYIAYRSILFKLIAVIATFLLIKKQDDYMIYGFISIFALTGSNLLNFIKIHKYVNLHSNYKLNLKRHLRPIFIFFSMSVATTVYTNLDTLMLGIMKTDVEVGIYQVAVKIKNLLVGAVTSLGVVMLPRSSYYIENHKMEEFQKISAKAMAFVMIFSLPMVLYFSLFARQSVLVLSGSAYQNAVLPMQFIMPSVLFIGLTNILGIQMMIPLGKEKIVLCSEILGAITNLVMNYFLIPVYGALGAAVGTTLAELCVLVIQYIAMKDMVRGLIKNFNIFAIFGCNILALSGVAWIKNLEINYLFMLAISAVLFALIYWVSLYLCGVKLIREISGAVFKKIMN